MPDPSTFPSNARACEPHHDTLVLNGAHLCYPDKNGADPWYYAQRPGTVPPGASPTHGNRPTTVTRGWNVGLLLLPYCRDYRDHPAPMTRRRAYPVIFHAFPHPADRTYALQTVTHFVPPSDVYAPKFMLHIITLPPFAGWRWHIDAARRWLDYAEAIGNSLGAPRSADLETATAHANAWIAAVKPYWQQLTIERFPYDASNLVRYWLHDEPTTALPTTP